MISLNTCQYISCLLQTASVPVLSPGAVSATVSVSHFIFHFILCRASAVFVPVYKVAYALLLFFSKAAASRTENDTASTVQLLHLWSEGLPPEDHKWVRKSILKLGPRGKLELQDHLKLWYFPPQPSQLYHQAPAPDRFFAHPLLVWMPYKLWNVKVVCPNLGCGQHQLTGAGLHKRARQVLDVDRIYNMGTETLTCTKCRSSHVSWSQTVLSQLDLAHRSEFRVILTQK